MPPYLHFNIHHFIKRLDPVQSRCSKLSPESRRISDALLVKFIPVCSNMVELWWSVFFREERRRFSAKNGRNPCRDQPSRNEQTRHDFVCSRGYCDSPSCLATRNTLPGACSSPSGHFYLNQSGMFFPFFKDIIEM